VKAGEGAGAGVGRGLGERVRAGECGAPARRNFLLEGLGAGW